VFSGLKEIGLGSSESSVASTATSSTLERLSNFAFNSVFSFLSASISEKNVSLTIDSTVFFGVDTGSDASTSTSTSGLQLQEQLLLQLLLL